MKKQKILIVVLVIVVASSVAFYKYLQEGQWRNYHLVFSNFEYVEIPENSRFSSRDFLRTIPVSVEFNETVRAYMKSMKRIDSTNFPPCCHFLIGTHLYEKNSKRAFALVTKDDQFLGYYLANPNTNTSDLSISRLFFFNDDKQLSEQMFKHIKQVMQRHLLISPKIMIPTE